MYAMPSEPFIIWVLTGMLTGFAASFVFVGNNVWRYLAAGVAGAVIVSYLMVVMGVHVPIADVVIRHFAIAVMGSLSVIVLARVFD